MNFNIENFKLTMRPEFTQFFVDGTNVTCRMYYQLLAPEPFLDICGFVAGEVVATAHCHKDDTFNLETGKKVALAKAESRAYKEARSVMNRRLQNTINTVVQLANMAKRFSEKAEDAIEHNTEYITRITQ